MEKFEKRRSLLEILKGTRKSEIESKEESESLYIKCKGCDSMIPNKDMEKNLKVCPKCGHHHYMSAIDRLDITLDKGYIIFNSKPKYLNPLDYPDYEEKLKLNSNSSEQMEAVIWARGKIEGHNVIVISMEQLFLMGSMGTYVGEEVTRAFEYAMKRSYPVIAFTCSGGARMQEGILSLMQMAKTSNAVREHSEQGLLYIAVNMHPTTGGVTASFASLGDINIAEPGALIGFAGPRVIKQTIGQDLPPLFQTAEFQLEHGFLDSVVDRRSMKSYLAKVLALHEVNYDRNN